MARNYPRFLFSNPKDTKSKGPFIVHTLAPMLVMKLTSNYSEWEKAIHGILIYEEHLGYDMYLIVLSDVPASSGVDMVLQDAMKWILAQLKTKAINL